MNNYDRIAEALGKYTAELSSLTRKCIDEARAAPSYAEGAVSNAKVEALLEARRALNRMVWSQLSEIYAEQAAGQAPVESGKEE